MEIVFKYVDSSRNGRDFNSNLIRPWYALQAVQKVSESKEESVLE